MFIDVILIIARNWKLPKCPSTDECIMKMWCLQSGMPFACLKNEIYTWKDGAGSNHFDRDYPDPKGKILHDFSYMDVSS